MINLCIFVRQNHIQIRILDSYKTIIINTNLIKKKPILRVQHALNKENVLAWSAGLSQPEEEYRNQGKKSDLESWNKKPGLQWLWKREVIAVERDGKSLFCWTE